MGHIQVITSSVDVLHCWSVPALGMKLDCCPGRLNETMLYIRRPGIFYGQCSEICGMNHAFMPIVVNSLKPLDYIIKLIKYHIKDPEPGTLWYSLIDCRSYFLFRVLIYGLGVILILFFFSIYRFIKEHESLVVFVYIIWFFSSLF